MSARNWIYCRCADVLGRWPRVRNTFDALWFRAFYVPALALLLLACSAPTEPAPVQAVACQAVAPDSLIVSVLLAYSDRWQGILQSPVEQGSAAEEAQAVMWGAVTDSALKAITLRRPWVVTPLGGWPW